MEYRAHRRAVEHDNDCGEIPVAPRLRAWSLNTLNDEDNTEMSLVIAALLYLSKHPKT